MYPFAGFLNPKCFGDPRDLFSPFSIAIHIFSPLFFFIVLMLYPLFNCQILLEHPEFIFLSLSNLNRNSNDILGYFLFMWLVDFFNTCFHMFKDLFADNIICCLNDKHMVSCLRSYAISRGFRKPALGLTMLFLAYHSGLKLYLKTISF